MVLRSSLFCTASSIHFKPLNTRVITQWNDEEDEALQGLPHLAQLLYLRCLRRFMDYGTGMVGVRRKVSYQMFRETLYVEPVPGRNVKDREATMQVLRTAIAQLERSGLVVAHSADRQLVFSLPMASRDESGQKRNNRGTTEEQQTSDNIPNPPPNKGFEWVSNRGTTEGNAARNNSPPGSGFREIEEKDSPIGESKKKRAEPKGERLPEGWFPDLELQEWARGSLGWSDNRIRTTTETFVDYWKGVPGAKGKKSDWPATWRNWARRDNEKAPAATNQNPGLSTPQAKRGNYEQPTNKQQRESNLMRGLGALIEQYAPDGGVVCPDGDELRAPLDDFIPAGSVVPVGRG